MPTTPPSRSSGASKATDSRSFAIEAARALSDDKCTDVLVLDVTGVSSVTDWIVIGTGTSDRQMRGILHNDADLGESLGHPSARTSSDERATWLLADFVDVIVHLFEPNARAYYDLEMLWGDAPRIPWERPKGERPPHAKPKPSENA